MKEENTIISLESLNKETEVKKAIEATELYKWQKKLLPFLVGMPAILIIIFIFLATMQINDFNVKLNEKKASNFIGGVIPSPSGPAYSANIDYIKWITLTHMEQESIDSRYKQAGFLLMSRVLTKYLGFLTGMILAIVGAAFIIGKLSEDKTNIEGTLSEKAKFSIASSSPGILFGVLGTALMLATILTHSEIQVLDQPLYLNPNTIQFIGKQKTDTVIPKTPHLINVNDLDPMDKVK